MYTTIFNVIYDLWRKRCNDRHQRIDQQPSVFQYNALVHNIKSLYKLRESVLPDDCIAFHDDVEIHLGDSERKLKDWLFRWRPVLLASAVKYSKLAASSTRTLDNYFQVIHSRPTVRPQKQRWQNKRPKPTPNRTLPALWNLPATTSTAKRKHPSSSDVPNSTHPPKRIKIQTTLHQYKFIAVKRDSQKYPDHPE